MIIHILFIFIPHSGTVRIRLLFPAIYVSEFSKIVLYLVGPTLIPICTVVPFSTYTIILILK